MKSRPLFIPQERVNTCGLACLRMVLDQQGLDVPSEDALLSRVKAFNTGIAFNEIQRLAEELGLKTDPVAYPPDDSINLERCAQLLLDQKSIIIAINLQAIDGTNRNHAVIPLTITEEEVTFLDPRADFADQQGVRVSKTSFQEAYGLALVCWR